MERSVSVVTDVKDVSELLNGASLEQVRLLPSEGRLRVELELMRVMPERATTVRRGLWTRMKTPWTKSRLTLHQIKEASVRRATDAPPEHTPLLACEAVPGGYTVTVTSPDGVQYVFKLEQLHGQFTDIGNPIEAP